MKKKSFLVEYPKISAQGKLYMDYTPWIRSSVALSEEELRNQTQATSLYETFQRLPDGRRKQGKRYELALLLCLLVQARLAGQTSLKGATEWIRHRASDRVRNVPRQARYLDAHPEQATQLLLTGLCCVY